MKRALLTSLSALLLCSTAVHAADVSESPVFAEFAAYNDDSRRHVDYTIWSDLMRDFVLNVPVMDRIPERARSINTGTRTSTANESRYRYEANRIAYHTMSDEYKAAISTYREELENLPNQIDFGSLNSDEQLAYWMNLHNVAIIEQVMLDYPVTRINRLRAHGTNENVFEAKILNVAGVPLSLNDIRLRIVYAQWDDPRVIYGFFNGAVGGPELSRNAFDGNQVWSQLSRNGREFVNSLRGVEVARDELRVSHIYRDAEKFFPSFDDDLRAHLSQFANETTAEQLVPGRRLRTSVEDWHIADLINGSTRCIGSGGASNMVTSAPADQLLGEPVAAPLRCSPATPTNAIILMQAVTERRMELIREGRYGEVFTRDVPTDPDGNPLQLRPAGEATEDDASDE
jgi:hypothetical protein